MKLFALAIATLIAAGGSAFAQGAPDPRPGASTPVQVMNTTTNPVPVTGAVTGRVTVTGDVSVMNSAGTVLTVASAAEMFPYQERVEILGSALPFFTFKPVPAGMRLVVEHVSGLIVLNPDDLVRDIFLRKETGGGPRQYLSQILITRNSLQVWNSINDRVLAYFEPGDTPQVFVQNDKVNAFGGFQEITLSGHFVPLP